MRSASHCARGVRVRPVDDRLHLLRRNRLPVGRLEEHVEQDRPQPHQFGHERQGRGYQTRINRALRKSMMEERKQSGE